MTSWLLPTVLTTMHIRLVCTFTHSCSCKGHTTDLLSANPTNQKICCKTLPGNWQCQFSMYYKDDPQSSQTFHSGKKGVCL